jgi:hypothetical protein
MLYPKNQTPELPDALFLAPTAEYRGAPFWAWNSRLERNTLFSQIEMLRDMGMGGFHMHSRVGLATPYMGEAFLEMVRACNEKAQEYGMFSWLYDEDRWPSGAAGGRVTKDHRYRSRYLLFSPVRAHTGITDTRAAYEATLDECTPGRGYWIASYAVTLRHGVLAGMARLPDDAPNPDEIDRDGATTRLWHAFLCVEDDNAWFNGQAYVNTLDPAAIRRFMEETHERYKLTIGTEFGHSVPAIFTDEPQFRRKEAFRFVDSVHDIVVPFTDDFPDTFRAAHGFDLLDHLPELFWELPDERVSVARYRYHDHLAERFAQAYADQIGEWCGQNGLMLTGHMMEEPTLESQTAALGEAMRSYRAFHLPGIDMLCDRREFSTAKQAQSAANQYGCPGVLSELYGVTNWDFPFRAHKMQGDWQAALGVSVRVHHLTWVSMEGEAKRDYPASIGEQSPWHSEYAMVEDYFSRLNTALTRGRPHVRIAAIHPVESYWLHWGPFEQTHPARSELESCFENLFHWLLPAQIDFDLISESLLPDQCPMKGEPIDMVSLMWSDEAGNVRFPVGKMRYEVILVPGNHTLRASTVERLAAFADAGGKVFFLGEPARLVDACPDSRVRILATRCQQVPFTQMALLSALEPWREVGVWTDEGRIHDNLIIRMRQDGTDRWLFLCHAWDRAKQTDWMGSQALEEAVGIRLAGSWSLTRYDALCGKISSQPATVCDGMTRFTTVLSIHDSLLLRLTPVQVTNEPVVIATQVDSVSAGRIDGIDLCDPVPVTLSEPNVMLLDMAEFRLGDGLWESEEELLRIDTRLRLRLGLPLRMDAMVQPWVLENTESGAETTLDESDPTHRVSLRFTIRMEHAVAAPLLGLEHPEWNRIRLNGQVVEPCDVGWFTDRCIRTVALPSLQAGTHVLELDTFLDRRFGLEWCYLLGDFGVRVDGRHKRIVEPVRYLAFGDWTTQGLPFYAGNITYHCRCEGTGENATLQATQFSNPLLAVAVDGKPAGRIAWAPYRLPIGLLEPGGHNIDITAFGNRFNAFGCVHLSNQAYTWFGSSAWRTEGLDWSYQYQLKPMGLLVAPSIR